MKWFTQDLKEWHTRFAWFPSRIAEHQWIWLQEFEQRLIDSRWVTSEAAAFVFERRLPGGPISVVTIYRM